MACTYRFLVVFQSVPTQVEGVKHFVHKHHEEEGNSPLTLEKSEGGKRNSHMEDCFTYRHCHSL